MTNLLRFRPATLLPSHLDRAVRKVVGWKITPRLGRRQWQERLARLEAAAKPLRAFSKLSDHEFAALANRLGQYRGQTDSLTSSARTLQELFADDPEKNALRRALALGKHAIELVHSSFGIADSVQSQFEEVSTTLEEALRARAQFESNMVVFRTLSIGFRIEAARCDAEHKGIFTTVANEFTSLEQQVSKSTAEAFAEIERLTEATRQGGHTSTDDREAFHRSSRRRVEVLRTHLDEMEAALTPCAEEVRQTLELLEQMPLHLVGIVQCLQYQDIVRQKLEHVEEGLALLASERKRKSSLFHQVCSVQKAQLRAAREQIQSAGERLLNGIADIAGVGEETAQRIHSLERTALEELGSRELAQCFSGDLAQLAEVAKNTEVAHQFIAAHVDQVEEVIRVFTHQIALQQNAVRLAALNAQVAAARLTNGGALEKLAEETSRIAKANTLATDALRTKLHETLSLLQKVRTEAADSLSILAQEKLILEDGVGTIESEISQFTDRIETDTRLVSEAFSEAHAALESLRQSVTFPHRLAQAFAPLEATLAEFTVVSAEDSAHAETTSEEAHRLLSQHASRYTMEEERRTHANALGTPTPVAAAAVAEMVTDEAPPDTPTPSIEDDDDGIELF